MGWKASTLIIQNPNREANEQLLQDLGFNHLTKINDEPFDVVIDPRGNRVYLGTYQNNLIICIPDIPMCLIENTNTAYKEKLASIFPDSEICSIVLHSSVNLWGYAIIINGEIVRARAGSSEDGTFIEFGEQLEEEKGLLSKAKKDESGKRIYEFDDLPDEIFSEDQVGENFVFSICSRYFGEPLDSVDELLYDTIMAGYSYRNIILPDADDRNKSQKANAKPWWKFW